MIIYVFSLMALIVATILEFVADIPNLSFWALSVIVIFYTLDSWLNSSKEEGGDIEITKKRATEELNDFEKEHYDFISAGYVLFPQYELGHKISYENEYCFCYKRKKEAEKSLPTGLFIRPRKNASAKKEERDIFYIWNNRDYISKRDNQTIQRWFLKNKIDPFTLNNSAFYESFKFKKFSNFKINYHFIWPILFALLGYTSFYLNWNAGFITLLSLGSILLFNITFMNKGEEYKEYSGIKKVLKKIIYRHKMKGMLPRDLFDKYTVFKIKCMDLKCIDINHNIVLEVYFESDNINEVAVEKVFGDNFLPAVPCSVTNASCYGFFPQANSFSYMYSFVFLSDERQRVRRSTFKEFLEENEIDYMDMTEDEKIQIKMYFD